MIFIKFFYFSDGQRVLRQTDLAKLTRHQFHKTKGAGARAIHHNLKKYSGISERRILSTLSQMPIHQNVRLRFTNKAPITPITAKFVMERLQIDLVNKQSDKVCANGQRYSYILSVLDVFSRYTWLRPLTGKSSKPIAGHLERVFQTYGQPKIVQHDQGKEFDGHVKELLEKYHVKQVRSAPYHPQSQGKVERMHSILQKVMHYDIYKQKSTNWVTQLPEYEQTLNSRPRKTLAFASPFEVFFGRKKRGNGSSADAIREAARLATERMNRRCVEKQEKTLRTPTYEIGDRVILRIPLKISRVTTKRCYEEGRIVDRNTRYYKYKVLYKLNGKKKCGWFNVKDMVASTLNVQKQRETEYMQLSNTITYNEQLLQMQDANSINIIFDPAGDGNCLFRAISHQIYGSDSMHSQVRKLIVSHLLTHPYLGGNQHVRWHDSLVDESSLEYLTRMSRDGIYGDHLILQAASEVYRRQIIIVSSLAQGNTIIQADGSQVFNHNQNYMVLGHLAETALCGYG